MAKTSTQADRITQLENDSKLALKTLGEQQKQIAALATTVKEGIAKVEAARVDLERRIAALEHPPDLPPHHPPDLPPVQPGHPDQVALESCILTPPDVHSWPITTALTRVELQPFSLTLTFDKQKGDGRWPDVTPFGWDGPIQYTVWFGAMLGGVPHLAASLNWYHGEPTKNSGPVTTPSHYPENLWYLDAALGAHTPMVGEPLLMMVTAGALRGVVAYQVAERSQVVALPFPPAEGAVVTL